ncbi:MAG: lipase family protein [Candidatus Dormibacteraceae bacterium]
MPRRIHHPRPSPGPSHDPAGPRSQRRRQGQPQGRPLARQTVRPVPRQQAGLGRPRTPGPRQRRLPLRALASIYSEVRDKIEEVRTNGQTLWFTGHSLGGALAMLAGATMYLEDPKLLADGVVTFGQPRTSDRFLANAYDAAFTSRHFRFVNNNDAVAQVPPEPVFHHVSAMMYFDADGKLHDKMPFAGKLKDSFKGYTSDPLAPGTDGIRDHSMDTYLTLIEKNLD